MSVGLRGLDTPSLGPGGQVRAAMDRLPRLALPPKTKAQMHTSQKTKKKPKKLKNKP